MDVTAASVLLLQLCVFIFIANGHYADQSSFAIVHEDDKIRQDDVIFDVIASSAEDCGLRCFDGCCMFFTYVTGMTSQANCRGHSSLMTSASTTTSLIGARSYSRAKPDPTGVRMTTQMLCASMQFKYAECAVPGAATPLLCASVSVSQQQSKAPCTDNTTFGIIPELGKMWANSGCRAVFNISYCTAIPCL